MNVWTPPVVSRFNELLKASPVLTYTQIAQRLSAEFAVIITKNSAIGFGRRTGAPKRSAVGSRRINSKVRARPPGQPPPPPKPRHLHVPDEVLLQNLDNGDCHWPHGDNPPYLYCGMPVLHSLPYCRKHALVAYPALRGKV